MSRFAVGDRVRVKARSTPTGRESVGRVVKDRGHTYEIQCDEWRGKGHDGDDGAAARDRWFMSHEDLTPVVPASPAPDAPPRYRKGDRVEIIGLSQIGYDYRGKRGVVSHVGTGCDSSGKSWVNVDIDGEPSAANRTYSLDAIRPAPVAAPPPPVTTSYVVMLRDEQGRVAPSKHPVEHALHGSADAEARRLATKHSGKPFDVWQRVTTHCVEPVAAPAAPVPATPQYRKGDQVRITGCTSPGHWLRVGSIATVLSQYSSWSYSVQGVQGREGRIGSHVGDIIEQTVCVADFGPLDAVPPAPASRPIKPGDKVRAICDTVSHMGKPVSKGQMLKCEDASGDYIGCRGPRGYYAIRRTDLEVA